MKHEYDLVVGFGPACSCSQTLRFAGLQLLSFPFDWNGSTSYENDMRRRTDIVVSKFENWLHINDLVCYGENTNGMYKYKNVSNKLSFIHDFPIGVPLEQSFPTVAQKYARRAGRLIDLVMRSRRVLVVRLDRPDLEYRTPVEDCRYARKLLSSTFSPVEFDTLLLCQDPDVKFGNETLETLEPGIFRIKFDYRDVRPGIDPAFPDLKLTSASVAKFFAVREYRTTEEITAYQNAEKRKRWAKYGATNAWQYRWKKFLAKLR